MESLLTQTLIIHIIRTNRIPFLQSWASWPLTVTTAVIMAIGAWLPFSPIASMLGFTAAAAALLAVDRLDAVLLCRFDPGRQGLVDPQGVDLTKEQTITIRLFPNWSPRHAIRSDKRRSDSAG